MLTEDQAAELLRRCEAAVGATLAQVRGNLKHARTRAAALWELLVIDAAAQIGPVEYEPISPGNHEGSPDVRLKLPEGRPVWLEAAFLDPRFWKEERKASDVVDWIAQELRRRGIPLGKVRCNIEGSATSKAGPVLRLPDAQERKSFLKEPGLRLFLDAIQDHESEDRCYLSPIYSISIHYNAREAGPYLASSRPVLEAPENLAEHALYRLLGRKARQHDVDLPCVVCVAGDRSQILSYPSGPGQLRTRDAVNELFARSGAVAAVIIVAIKPNEFGRGETFLNPNARTRLADREVEILRRLDFNRWKYAFPLPMWESSAGLEWTRRLRGPLTFRPLGGQSMELEIPANVLVDILAGKTTLMQEYGAPPTDPVLNALRDGWGIEDCQFRIGDIQSGVGHKIVLTLSAIPAVYSSKGINQA